METTGDSFIRHGAETPTSVPARANREESGGIRQAHGESPARSRASFVRSTAHKIAARLVRFLANQQLTVICYHRVLKAGDDRFQGYKPTISASQNLFTQQIDFLRANYDPVSLQDLVAWLDCGQPLQPRPALVTF